jgi:hypothetical protein
VFFRGYGFLFSSEKKEEATTKRHEKTRTKEIHWIKTEMSSLTGDVNTSEQEETAPECATVEKVSDQAKMNIFNNLTNPL